MHKSAAWLAGLLLVISLAFVAGSAFSGHWQFLPLLLANIPMTLAIALLRRTRSTQGLMLDSGRLVLAWALAGAATYLALIWPLGQLLASPSLHHSLMLSGLLGVLLLVLWWRWPSLHLLSRQGGSAAARFNQQQRLQAHAWRGLLQVAIPVFLLLCAAALISQLDDLPPQTRLLCLLGYALFLPLAHVLLQTASASHLLQGLPVVEMDSPALQDAPEAVLDSDINGTLHTLPMDQASLNRQLYAAARNGRVEQALTLLDDGADPFALPDANAPDRRSLPILVAVLPDLRLLRTLIERGIDVNAMQDGINPLLAATRDSWHGRAEAVMTLLANGASPHISDNDGNTPLHHAARSTDPGVAALLLDAGADLNALNHDGLSPLGSACTVGNWRLARFLLERGAQTAPEHGLPVLHAAAAHEDDDIAGIQLLLRHKASLHTTNQAGRTALHEAAAANNPEICAALLTAGAHVDAHDHNGMTPFLCAAQQGARAALDTLLNAKADPHACDQQGSNALHLACAAEHTSVELVQQLLALGLAHDALDHAQQTPLDIAKSFARWPLIAVLDPQADLPSLQEEAAQPERPPLLRLREALLDNSTPRIPDALMASLNANDFSRLLCDSEITMHADRVEWLLQHGANPEIQPPGACSPVSSALQRGGAGIDVLQRLFAYGASPVGRGTLAQFLVGALNTSDAAQTEAFALELLARGADPFCASESGEPCLLLAMRLGWTQLLQRLLAMGLDPNHSDIRGITALHFAAEQGALPPVKTLIAYGADPSRHAADGQTPLGIALACSQHTIIHWLDWRIWPLPRRPLLPVDLPAAAIAGDLDAVQRLLSLGFPIDTTDTQGCTALLRASGGGHLPLVEALLAQGANPNLAAHTGATALSAAASMRQLPIVDALLAANCSLEQRLPGDVTVLMLAAALGQPALVSRLLQAGADLHAVDAQGLTPLHCAAVYGFTARDRTTLLALLDSLLLAGARLQQTTHNGTDALLFLLGARNDPGTHTNEDVLLAALQYLLEEGVRFNARDPRGFGPLHLATLHGLPRVIDVLLRAGADPDARDNLNRTAHDIAVIRGDMEIATHLANPITPAAANTVSVARFLREP